VGSGSPYELYVGRWSRRVARGFLAWLAVPSGQRWGDVGCGTGALVESILTLAEPSSVLAIDRSEAFLAEAQRSITDQRVRFELADATDLPWASAACDATVSGLVLNFVPDAGAMVREMVRVTRPKGKVAAYVWDYASGMQMMRQFWDAALEVSPQDTARDQAERFPLCQPEPLKTLFRDAGLRGKPPENRVVSRTMLAPVAHPHGCSHSQHHSPISWPSSSCIVCPVGAKPRLRYSRWARSWVHR
jgi:trans-aconitate methyltransferase